MKIRLISFAASMLIAAFSFAQKAVAPTEFQDLIDNQAAVQLIDVRTAGEYNGGYLTGAQNLDIRSQNFTDELKKLDKDRPVFVYCLSGGRSASAARKLVGMGFSEVIDMQGGIMAWKRAGLPLEGASIQEKGMSRVEYDKLISSSVPVLVDFYAAWCGPCKKMAPMLEELQNDHAGKFKLVKVDADKNDALLKELNVNEIPTFYLYKNSKQTWQHVGLVEKETLLKELGL